MVGAVLEGPKTEKVIVVVSLVPEEDPKVAAGRGGADGRPGGAGRGGDVVTLKVGDATPTVVSGMLTLLHRLAAALLLAFER